MKSLGDLYKQQRTHRALPDPSGTIYRTKVEHPKWTLDSFFARHGDKYRLDSTPDTSIFGTATAASSALWLFALTQPAIWNWFFGKVQDGYAMVLFSPFIILYWILVILLYIPTAIILSLLVVLSGIWAVVIELPASLMNRDTINFGNANMSDTDLILIQLKIEEEKQKATLAQEPPDGGG